MWQKGYHSIKFFSTPLKQLFETCLVFSSGLAFSNQRGVCGKNHTLLHTPVFLGWYLGILKLKFSSQLQIKGCMYSIYTYNQHFWSFMWELGITFLAQKTPQVPRYHEVDSKCWNPLLCIHLCLSLDFVPLQGSCCSLSWEVHLLCIRKSLCQLQDFHGSGHTWLLFKLFFCSKCSCILPILKQRNVQILKFHYHLQSTVQLMALIIIIL